jgi:hypothetical protein
MIRGQCYDQYFADFYHLWMKKCFDYLFGLIICNYLQIICHYLQIICNYLQIICDYL